MDETLLREASQEAVTSPHRHLSLKTRGRIWSSFGDYAPEGAVPGSQPSSAHRGRLGLLSIIHDEVIRPIWAAELERWSSGFESTDGPLVGPSDDVNAVVDFVFAESRTTAEVEERARRFGTFAQYFYEIWDKVPRAVLCLQFAQGLLHSRVYDLRLYDDDYEEGNDRWKPDVYACWAFAGSIHLYKSGSGGAREESLEKRALFWRWYCLDAVPRAQGASPLAPVNLYA